MKNFTLLIVACMAMLTFNIQAQETEIVLTQSTDEVFIKGGVSCPGGDNSWYRYYTLSDEGITTDVKVVGIQFGIESLTFDEELQISAYNYSGFPAGFDSEASPTPIASGVVTVTSFDMGTIVTAYFDTPALVSAGSSIVVRVAQPSVSGNQLFLAITEQDSKSGFITTAQCGLSGEPTPMPAAGFPAARHMINLIVTDGTLSLNNNLIENITVFPNPTNGNTRLKVPSNIEILKVKMFDVLGKDVGLLYRNAMLETAQLSPGVYILQVETSHGVLTKKIVRQ